MALYGARCWVWGDGMGFEDAMTDIDLCGDLACHVYFAGPRHSHCARACLAKWTRS